MERQLDSKNTADAKATATDHKVTGNPDVWELVCKFSSKDLGLMKSTKRMRVPGGWLYQVTTEHCDIHKVTACAEALSFVPDSSPTINRGPVQAVTKSSTPPAFPPRD